MLAARRKFGNWPMTSRAIAVLLLAFVVGCQSLRSSRAICDEQFGPESDLVARPSAPANYRSEIIQPYFSPDPQFEINEGTFAAADVVWYQRESGESVACVVFEGSDRVNGYFVLSKDLSVSRPDFFTILGPS